MNKTATTRKVWLPAHGQWVHFHHRDTMTRAVRNKASFPKAVPVTTLPVDCTGNATVSCPMLGNDQYGDCGPVMCAHVDQIRQFGQGKPGFGQVTVNQAALVAQYERVSGGDNGTDEPMLVGPSGIWMTGLAGDPSAVVVDHLDVDITDIALTRYCHDQFYHVNMAWSVPDDFINGFATGTSWLSAMTPNPNNGHFTPLSDVDASGDQRVWTWGTWALLGQAFIESVQPQCFVTFSPLQFSKSTGYDSHGRHVSEQAAKWVAIGGNASLVAAVVALFPPIAAPPPIPAPTQGVLTAPQVTSVQAAISAVVDPCDALIEKVAIAPQLQAAVAALGPAS